MPDEWHQGADLAAEDAEGRAVLDPILGLEVGEQLPHAHALQTRAYEAPLPYLTQPLLEQPSAALEILGRELGMFHERHEGGGDGAVAALVALLAGRAKNENGTERVYDA